MQRNIAIALLVLGLGAILRPAYERRVTLQQERACVTNFRDIGMALELYSIDAAGRYPGHREIRGDYFFGEQHVQLTQLARYLHSYPTCPTGDEYRITTGVSPDLYTVICGGHPRMAYTSVTGFIHDRRGMQGWE